MLVSANPSIPDPSSLVG